MEEIEIWKDVPGYEGKYQISTLSRVKTIANNATRKERVIKSWVDNTGYSAVKLYQYGVPHWVKIHQLMAILFLGHTPCGNTLVINHIDGNKLNNKLRNLEIVTHRANTSTCFRKNKEKLSSQYVGVSWSKKSNKWEAHIRICRKRINLGMFTSEIEASNAYQKALSSII